MQLTQDMVMASEFGTLTPLGVEGEIFFMNQPGVPPLCLEHEDPYKILVWEEPCGIEYVPQFTTSMGRVNVWRQIIVPIQREGNLRRVKLQPYCHSRIFRLWPRPARVRITPTSVPRRRAACAWWRQWLPLSLRVVMLWLTCATGVAVATGPLDTWHSRVSPGDTTINWRAISFGNNRFVVVGNKAGNVLTSEDGVDWTLHATSTTKSMFGLTFGNGIFVAAGLSGKVFTSTDGAGWTPAESNTSAHLNDVSFVNGSFVAVGDRGTILFSPNGTDWTLHQTHSTNYWQGVAYGKSVYVAAGYEWKTSGGRSAASTDFTNWDARFTGAFRYLSSIAFGSGKFVACGYAAGLQMSENGTEWTDSPKVAKSWLKRITYANNLFAAVGESGLILTSPDGLEWTARHTAFSRGLQGIAFGNGTFVAVGDNGLILQSDSLASDGAIHLTEPGSLDAVFAFQFNGEIGQVYEIQSSADLIHWAPVGTVTCTQSPMPCNHVTGFTPNGFYRVVKH